MPANINIYNVIQYGVVEIDKLMYCFLVARVKITNFSANTSRGTRSSST
jgi:hypothetical protein